MGNIYNFLIALAFNNEAIWMDNESLNLHVRKQNTKAVIIDFIKTNRTELVAFLKQNKITSLERFVQAKELFDNRIKKSPLSFAQERLWFLEVYENGFNAYHLPMVFEVSEPADKDAISYAIQCVIARHKILRSTIEEEMGQGFQVIHEAALQIKNETVNTPNALNTLLLEEINRPFDLKKEYPIRVKFYTMNAGTPKVVVLINIHHIASDGWSSEIFKSELDGYYNAYTQNDTSFNPPDLKMQYKDFATWQRLYLTHNVLEEQLEYWKNKLSGYQQLELPTDYPRSNSSNYQGANQNTTLSKALSDRIKSITKKHGVTMHSVLLSVFHILLNKYSGQQDIVTGSMMAGRHHRQVKDLIGFFVNPYVNRTVLNDHHNFEDLILQVHKNQIEAQYHQDLPFEHLVAAIENERTPSYHPIFQVVFSVQSFDNREEESEDLNQYLRPHKGYVAHDVAQYDLSVFVDDSKDKITCQFNYATCLFKKSTIKRFVNDYLYLLEQFVDTPKKKIKDIDILRPKNYQEIVYNWNSKALDFSSTQTLSQLFKVQAKKTPNAIALVFENKQLTYRDVDEKSNQLARSIRKRYLTRTNEELPPDTLIALCLRRNLEMIIGIIGILKSGAAYVPIDSDYPKERFDYILEDTNAFLVLTQKELTDKVSALPEERLMYIDLDNSLYRLEDKSDFYVYTKSTDLAYVIYTSGTTGVPKGVMIEQHSVISLVHNNFINQTQEDTFAFLSSPVFDAATFEIWAPLLKGSALVIPKDSKQLFSDVKQFEQFIKTHHISILWLTKTLFDSLYFLNPKWCENLNYLIIGGEALDRKIINQILKSKRKPKHFLNGYGPTESTTFTCIYNLNTPIKAANVPIGKPINNRSVYILDTHRKPVPVGAVGELYIGGSGLARGYLNNSALTKHCFVNNLFATEVDKQKGHIRLYKTGDLVKWLPDGDIEYIGRKDGQVKIRGYRIELSEIEQALLKITGIQQSCVLVKNRKTSVGIDKYIVGYYVLDANRKLKERDITIALSKLLPSYLMPSSFLEMDNFPLTTNGKLDKKTFPDVEFTSQKTYVAPSTTLEKELCNIWQEVIGLEKIGITDDFFKIGGNSILAIKLVSVIRSTLKKEVTVKQLFLHGTIRKLVEIITISKSESEYLGEVVRLEKESFLAIDASNIKKLNKYSNPPKHVFLTGATGFVGCFLLHELLRRTTSNVYCLVRVDTVFNGKQKILNQLNDFGLNVKGFEDRILPVIGDLSKINLGINDRHYKFLEASLDYIYHAATHMDHFSSYSRLKKVNVGGIEEIIKLATTKVLKKVIYLSTTSGLKKTAKEKDSRKDEIHYSASGYSTSKWVGEDVLIRAIENGFPAQIYRLGLITGHVGDFKKPNNQWFTQLLESCSNLGAYPKGVTFSVLPVNFIAEALIQMSLKEHIVSDIFHLCNPNFLDLEYFFSRSFSKIEKMPLKDWLIKLKSRSDAFTSLPIVKFIDFEAENIKSIISGESNKTLFPIEVPCTQYTEERLDQEINITFPKMQKEYTV